MTWIKFALWLSGMYAVYYLILILWDAVRNGGSSIKEDKHELTFVEHHEPVRLETDPAGEFFPSAVMSSGGVSLKQLFNLAREEAVEFTRPVSFL